MAGVRTLSSLLNYHPLGMSRLTTFAYQQQNMLRLSKARLQSLCLCTNALRSLPFNSKDRRQFVRIQPSHNSEHLLHTSSAVLKKGQTSNRTQIHRTNPDHRSNISPRNRPESDYISDRDKNSDEDWSTTRLDDQDYATLLHNAMGFGAGVVQRAGLKGGVFVILPWVKWGPQQKTDTTPELVLDEACSLVGSLEDVTVLGKKVVKVKSLTNHPFGTGQMENLEIQLNDVRGLSAVFVSVDVLSLDVIRNLEEHFGVRVVDRYWVVLSIFYQHAHSREAKMQVALAELPYIRKRTRHDSERAIIDNRTRKLKLKLKAVKHRREEARIRRARSELPSVAVVGYTNSGKTSLISALCKDSAVQGNDRMFATLDVTNHGLKFPCGIRGVLVDTVGFVQDLPTPLVACFNATVQDAANADVIIHVRDLSHPDRLVHHTTVMQALADINVSPKTPIITLDNKSDLVDDTVFYDIMKRRSIREKFGSDKIVLDLLDCVSYLGTTGPSADLDTPFEPELDTPRIPMIEEDEEESSDDVITSPQLPKDWIDEHISTPSLLVSAKTQHGLNLALEAVQRAVLKVTNREVYRFKLPLDKPYLILRSIVRTNEEILTEEEPEMVIVTCVMTPKEFAQFNQEWYEYEMTKQSR